MELVFQKDATITKIGGSVYLRLEEPFFTAVGVEKPTEESPGIISGHDAQVALGIGKHGKFVFLFSPKEQKKWQEQKKRDVGE
jgi:hypothetical protein